MLGIPYIGFNNAGTEGQFGLLTTEQTVEHYHQICDINIRGVLLSMKHEIPAILRSGGGAIVNNSSVGGHIGFQPRRVVRHATFSSMLTEHPYVRPGRPKESVQNVRFRVVASIASKSG